MIDKHWSLAEKFLKKWFWLYAFSFIIWPIWYLIKIIISKDLKVEEIWIIYWFLSLITLISAFNDFWMTESLNKFIPEFATQKKYDKVKLSLFYAFCVQIITWIILFLFFYFFAWFVATNYLKSPESINVVKTLSFYYLWINIFGLISTFFRAIQNTFLHKLWDFVRMIFVFWMCLFFFLTKTWNIENYSLSWLTWIYAWMIFWTILFYFKYYRVYLKDEKIYLDKTLIKKIFSYSILVFISAQASTILSQMDMQMILYFLWNKDAWFYTNYLSLINIPVMLLGPIFLITLSIFSQLHSSGEIEKIKKAKELLSSTFIIISTSLNIFFFVFSKQIALFFFWEKFLTSWVILKYSILFLVFNFLLQINFSILAAIWQLKERLRIISIAIIFNWILNLIFIKIIWAAWAALATWLGWILIYVLSEIKLKEYKIWLDKKMILKNIIFLWIIWILMNLFVVDLFVWLSTFKIFIWLWICFVIYYLCFALINFRYLKSSLGEVKRLKKKN